MTSHTPEQKKFIREVIGAKLEQSARDISERISGFIDTMKPEIDAYVSGVSGEKAYAVIIVKLIEKYEVLGISRKQSTQHFQHFVRCQIREDMVFYNRCIRRHLQGCVDDEDRRITMELFPPSVILSRGGRLLEQFNDHNGSTNLV